MAFNVASFAKRAAIAVVGAPLILWALHLGGFPLLGFLAAVVAVGQWELYGIARTKGYAPATVIGLLGGAGTVVLTYYAPGYVPALFVLAAILLFLREARQVQKQQVLENVAVTLFGMLYVAWLPAHALLFHSRPAAAGLPGGPYWLPVVIIGIWIFDTFCYLAGSWLGRHKLFPRISPNKTWEGLAGGIIALAAVSPLLFRLVPDYAVWYDYAAVPLLVGLMALGGDLFESMLKRDAGVKDASNLIPGHGGVLDRFDSMIVVVPVLYWYFHFTRAAG